jgi:hypothetical protein
MKKRFKVEELYKTAKQSNVSLLPVNTSFEWWEEYENNTSIYDRYILDTFRNFYYWVVFSNSTPADALTDFKEAIVSFLTINQKRFSELYRLHVLPDSAYDIVNNYSVTESSTRTTTEGERSDVQATTLGQHVDEETTSIGSRTDSSSNSIGARVDTSEAEISAFNSSEYQDANKTTNNTGAQTSSGSVTSGAQSNTVNSTFGAQSNSETFQKGEQENVEVTEFSRAGNIGVQTPADVIGGHLDLWDRFNFYKQIFDEIAKSYFVCQNRHR